MRAAPLTRHRAAQRRRSNAPALKPRRTDRRVLVPRHGGVVVHLQTLPGLVHHLLVLLLPAALAALAAAAAVFAAEAEGGGHHGIPRRQGAHGPRQEVPAAEAVGQEADAVGLHHVDDDHEDRQGDQWHADAHQDLPARHRQAEDGQREDQEAHKEVEGGEPAVLGGAVAEASRQPDGQPREGDGIPQQDAHDVEEEVAEGDLKRNQAVRWTLAMRSLFTLVVYCISMLTFYNQW